MPTNRSRPEIWDADIRRSVEFYNDWFLRVAPEVFRKERVKAAESVEGMLAATDYLTAITPARFRKRPEIVSALRMSTAPPIARDRLVGLAGVSKSLVETMEKQNRLAPRMSEEQIDHDLDRIAQLMMRIIDHDLFPWLDEQRIPGCHETFQASLVVADRICDAGSDQIIRNAQEARQLAAIETWLAGRGYRDRTGHDSFDQLGRGTYLIRSVVPGQKEDRSGVNLPMDVVIMPHSANSDQLPILVEAKSAGDFANTNKRRKEEATKLDQLRRSHGDRVRLLLFLCGYFNRGYLEYEAAEGIDWIWEHRVADFEAFGL